MSEEDASARIAATKRYYEKYADNLADRRARPFAHLQQFKYMLDNMSSSEGRVVDIGCADGTHAPLFLGIGRHLAYTGVDLSERFVGIARERYPQLDFLVGDVTDIDTLPRGPFDGFWCVHTLSHVPKVFQNLAFVNITRICRPGAIGYITLAQKHPSGRRADTDPRHFEIMEPEEQRELLLRHGWKIRVHDVIDGFNVKSVWCWYIVELPS